MIVFTNGCFDILHAGHVDILQQAKKFGSKLIVGINSDRSVRAIKGPDRPIQDQEARKAVLEGLASVDEVIIFDELTPEQLIKQLKPDVLVKGGDWQTGEIIGADFVESYGGKVYSLPLVPGFSSSDIVARIKSDENPEVRADDSVIERSLSQHVDVIRSAAAVCQDSIAECAELILKTFQSGKKVLLCGNGGSAADAQHIAAEFVGRYETERRALPAISLTTDTSALTAIANDYDVERIFARQVEALASEGDCLIAISTSGNSPNVISAVMTARNR
ncbi:MAG: D-glycero-beta-D-manno-heptose 1-phosphate adenylyltransferase, partial [Pyrinomonadaceae bacterium]